ncbi:MAG TPA: hypothetical protein VLG41_11450 [Hydrogenophaga sp.]|uniref:hypothetical protein n=1 Tax=Hydrogenophaga sp. TaxID=1904254 RepID=UPI002C1F7BE8|nr:hypothetical protein [Hydrogenophaga sp.]HSX93531.1 hypothetical protein [Hydrogenophaga sp.]
MLKNCLSHLPTLPSLFTTAADLRNRSTHGASQTAQHPVLKTAGGIIAASLQLLKNDADLATSAPWRPLTPAQIEAYKNAIAQEQNFWVDMLKNDPKFKHRLLDFIARQQAFHRAKNAGELSIVDMHKAADELATAALVLFRLADEKGWTLETRVASVESGYAYVQASINAFRTATNPNKARMVWSVLHQVVKAKTSIDYHMPLQYLRWVLDLALYVPWQAGALLRSVVDNAHFQSPQVGEQNSKQAYFVLNVPSNQWKTVNPTTGKEEEHAFRSTRSVQRDLDVVADCIKAIRSGDDKVQKAQLSWLRTAMRRCETKMQLLASKYREQMQAQQGTLTPEEKAVRDAMGDMERLQAMLAVKDTPNACYARSRKAITYVLRQYAFYGHLCDELTAASKKDKGAKTEAESQDEVEVVVDDGRTAEAAPSGPPDPKDAPLPFTKGHRRDELLTKVPGISDSLRQQYIELLAQVFTLEGFDGLNFQEELSDSRSLRALLQAIITLLSLTPNIMALKGILEGGLTPTAFDLAPSSLGFGFVMDVALLFTVWITPEIYALTHTHLAKGDMLAKEVAKAKLFAPLSVGHLLGTDGLLSEQKLKNATKGNIGQQFEHLRLTLEYDGAIYREAMLAYAVDPSTRDEHRAHRVKLTVNGETVTVPRTYRALSRAFEQCASMDHRKQFIHHLGVSMQLPEHTRESMEFILALYENNLLNCEHAKSKNVKALLGPHSTLPPHSQKIVEGALRYAVMRFQMYLSGDLSTSPDFEEAQAHSIALGHKKGSAESNSMVGAFQTSQKAVALHPFGGSLLPALTKLLSVGTTGAMEVSGQLLWHGTAVKAAVNLFTLVSNLVGILLAYSNKKNIKKKNDWRLEFKLDGQQDIAGTSIRSRHGLFTLNVARLKAVVDDYGTLLAEPIPQEHQPSVAERAKAIVWHILSPVFGPAAAPGGHADGKPFVVAPIPDMPFNKTIHVLEDAWSQVKAANIQEIFTSILDSNSELNEDELKRALQSSLNELEDLYLQAQDNSDETSASSSTTLISSSSGGDSGANDPLDLKTIRNDLVTMGFLSDDNQRFTVTEKKQRIGEAIRYFHQKVPLEAKDEWRRVWQRRIGVLRSAADALDEGTPRRQDYEQAIDMLEEMLKSTRGKARPSGDTPPSGEGLRVRTDKHTPGLQAPTGKHRTQATRHPSTAVIIPSEILHVPSDPPTPRAQGGAPTRRKGGRPVGTAPLDRTQDTK